jgi:hypothetical protein
MFQDNVNSLRQAPLSRHERRGLIARAKAGEDVYAYRSRAGWNLWADGMRRYLGQDTSFGVRWGFVLLAVFTCLLSAATTLYLCGVRL